MHGPTEGSIVEERTTATVACSLTASDLKDRRERWRQLIERAAVESVTTADGRRLLFHTAPGVESELRELAALERTCCAFAEWRVHTSGETLVLDVTAQSAEGVAAVHAMFEPRR
jgi:hypothetical protein